MVQRCIRGFAAFIFFSFISSGQVQAQLFQNNNQSCEDNPVADGTFDSPNVVFPDQPAWALGVTCGRFNDDTASGNPDFPDCGTVRDPLPALNSTAVATYSVLTNTAQHGINNCLNAGGTPQFTAQDLTNNNLTTADQANPIRLGSIVNGNLDGGGFNDLAHPTVLEPEPVPAPTSRTVEQLFSNAGGGFSTGDTVSALLEPAIPIPLVPIPLFFSNFFGFFVAGNSQSVQDSDPGDRSMILLNCDGDGVDEAIVGVTREDLNTAGIMVLQNSGTGLEDGVVATGLFFLPSLAGDSGSVALTRGDFNRDGILDIAAVVSNSDTDYVAVCQGNGNCSFDCPLNLADGRTVDLDSLCPGGPNTCNPFAPSIVAGDFNGDTLVDLAIPEIEVLGTHQVRYFINDGANNLSTFSTWFSPIQTLPVVATLDLPKVITAGQFSTVAVQNSTDEVAVTVNHINPPPSIKFIKFGALPLEVMPPTVEVVTTNGAGGFNAATTLTFTPTDSQITSGVEAADFDHCGGDDLMALVVESTALDVDTNGFTGASTSTASLFLNANEPPVANAGPDVSTDVNVPVNLAGTCSDPTNDDRTFTWTLLSSPSGSAAIFGTPTGSLTGTNIDAPTTFTADLDGTYTVEISCVDFCGLAATDTAIVTTVFVGENTQGGCLTNQLSNGPFNSKGVWIMLGILPIFYLFRRMLKRSWWLGILILGMISLSGSSFALTKSFSVNSFEPTMDDSEYFTIYSSPTMLKRNYHVGFYLDYAADTYEFGDNDFNRIGGIVDHLLTGNVVGSYGIFDWFTVGVLIPVHFWEGIRSNNPALLADENNFDLGDVQLLLKFRLLDREKHHVGISVVPYAIFPTSTGTTDFLGNGSFAGAGKVIIDGRIADRVSLALNVGYIMRSNVFDVGGNELDDQFFAGLGISVDILKKKLKIIGEGQIATVVKNFFQERRTTPAEARVGFRYTFKNNHDINAGAGFGLSNGISSPAWRAFVGYTYTKRPIAEVAVPPPPISEVQVGDELTLKDKIYFEFDKAVIRDISKPTLDKIAGFLKAHPEVTKIKIDGHTCDLGSNSYNQKLSDRRAQAVVTYLEGQGIGADRIGTVQGFGETQPLVPNLDEPHREQNRRVQIFVQEVAKPQ